MEAVGVDNFRKESMCAFAIAVSWLNRWKNIDDVTYPAPWAEQNQANYLKDGMADFKEEMKRDLHTGIWSNECLEYNKCCGGSETWKFKWPGDPQPSLKQWVEWWSKVVQKNKANLWANPISDLP